MWDRARKRLWRWLNLIKLAKRVFALTKPANQGPISLPVNTGFMWQNDVPEVARFIQACFAEWSIEMCKV